MGVCGACDVLAAVVAGVPRALFVRCDDSCAWTSLRTVMRALAWRRSHGSDPPPRVIWSGTDGGARLCIGSSHSRPLFHAGSIRAMRFMGCWQQGQRCSCFAGNGSAFWVSSAAGSLGGVIGGMIMGTAQADAWQIVHRRFPLAVA